MRPLKQDNGLRQKLLDRTTEGTLWTAENEGAVRCFACGHRCHIPKGFDGICKVRSNHEGRLRVPWGYAAGLQIDPIEKKPFFHAYPGAETLSFGMLGCDYRCAYCQNWNTSQTLRDKNATAQPTDISASEIVEIARKNKLKLLTSTYNEPLITAEWAVEIFKQAKPYGIQGAFVSNGNATPEVLEFIRPHVDLYKIDLKGFSAKSYRELGGVLDNVLRSIERVFKMGFWLEIVTLIVPGLNDDPKELDEMASFIAGVSTSIPWHVTAFHSDYKMQATGSTQRSTLLEAAETGKRRGLQYVYVGNLPGQVGRWENTVCPVCDLDLIERVGFQINENRLKQGRCPSCETGIAGRWT